MPRLLTWIVAGCLAAFPALAAPPNLLIQGATNPSLNCNFLGGVTTTQVSGKVVAGPRCPSFTFSRSGSGTYFDATGTMQTAASGVPRFDHNPVTLAPLGILLEEARTNLLLNSGTLATQTVTVTATAYVLSFYGAGTVTLSGAGTGSLVGSGAYPTRSTLSFTPSAGSLVATVTGTVSDAQIEAGSFVTSYIPTTGATAARGAEAMSVAVGPWYNARGGSLLAAIQWEGSSSSFSSIAALAGANSNTDAIGINLNNSTSNLDIREIIRSGGSQTGSSLPVSPPLTGSAAIETAVSYSLSGTVCVAAGGSPAVATGAISLPAVIQLLVMGAVGFQNPPSGWVAKLRYWPVAFPPTALAVKTLTP